MPSKKEARMCLRCRGSGHVVAECMLAGKSVNASFTEQVSELRPLRWRFFRKKAELCKRCRAIGLSWSVVAKGSIWTVLKQRDKVCTNLGPVQEAVFQKGCPLCVLLFEITPDPEGHEEDLITVMTFTLNRLGKSRSSPIVLEQEDLPWTECLYTALKVHSTEPALCRNAPNAICSINNVQAPQSKILGGRIIPEAGVDFDLIQSWLSRCEKQHGKGCEPEHHDELRSIRLIDVESREIVSYPDTASCSYLALSYMWGKMLQQSYDLGAILERLPPTIEDAITVTKRLGEQFLWVDSICINQTSGPHKQNQVKIMDSIYGGARLTLVALSRSDADFGLCRVRASGINSSHADDDTHHQSRCRQVLRSINGEKYVTILPTLDQQIRKSRWRYRGWTLQEALLSPRCLFFSCDQVYFQCNIIQCCESLDDSSNPVFPVKGDSQASRIGLREKLATVSIMEDYPTGSFINPFTTLENKDSRATTDTTLFDQLFLYDHLLEQYSGRELSHDSDAINAFAAILQKFQQKSGSEVFWGVPTAAMPWTLLWEEESYCNRRRPEFPSWSWAGWQGPLFCGHYSYQKPGTIHAVENPGPLVHIWRIENQQPVKLFSPKEPNPQQHDFRCWKFVLSDLSRLPARIDDVDFAQFPDAGKRGLLLIDGIILRLPLIWSPPQRNRYGVPEWEYHTHIKVQFGNIRNPRLPPEEIDLGKLEDMVGKPQDFLLMLGKDMYDHPARRDSALFLSLILLRWEGNVAYRVAVMYLRIQGDDKDDILKHDPQRRRFMLG
jgi:Heterokaryon incompatibility protein (HET)